MTQGWIAAATSGMIVMAAMAPAAAADETVNWTADSSMSVSQPGIALGDVAFTSGSATFAAWTLTSGSNYQPNISRSVGGQLTTWSLDTATATPSQTRLALSQDGSVGFAVYKKMVGGVRKLLWSMWNGTVWSEGKELSASVDQNTPPAVDIRRDGTFGVVAWRTLGNGTLAARFDGSTFAPADTLDAGSTGGMLSAAVAASANRAIISWITTTTQMRSRAWTAGAWAPSRDVSQNPGASTTSSGVVDLSADGSRSVAIFVMDTGAETTRTALGNGDTWNAASTLGQTVAEIQDVDVALSADGSQAWAAWGYDTGSAGNSVYLQRAQYTSGSWSGSTVVGGPWSDDTSPTPDVTISDSGERAVLAYRGKADSANFIGRVENFSQGAWSSAIPVGSINGDPISGLTRMALSPNGTLGSAVAVQKSGGSQSLVRKGLRIDTVPDTPSVPVPESVTTEFGTFVRLSWTAPSFKGNLPLTGYSVQSDPGGPVCDAGPLPTCTVQGMVPGVDYRFRVTAINSKGASGSSEWSSPVALPVTPVPRPTVAKVAVKQGRVLKKKKRKVVVSWSTTNPATSYRVRITKPGAKKWKAWRTKTRSRVTFALKRSAKFRVSVEAKNSAGVSPAKTVRFRVKR